MTESEAINVLNMIEAHGGLAIKAKQTAINALEKVQQYRAIGTLEELKEAMKYVWLVKKHGTIGKALEECAEYESIGTPEECRAAMERQNPIAAIAEKEDTGTTKYTCQACGRYMGWSTGTLPARYCWKCGQKFDWSDGE
jgi:DNA-directed RNA polymerase subunit RPC12/RpoP